MRTAGAPASTAAQVSSMVSSRLSACTGHQFAGIPASTTLSSNFRFLRSDSDAASLLVPKIASPASWSTSQRQCSMNFAVLQLRSVRARKNGGVSGKQIRAHVSSLSILTGKTTGKKVAFFERETHDLTSELLLARVEMRDDRRADCAVQLKKTGAFPLRSADAEQIRHHKHRCSGSRVRLRQRRPADHWSPHG